MDQSSATGVPLILISLSGDRSVRLVPAEALVALFGLTVVEASLANAFVSGLTLEEYAQRCGVGLGTVRFQIVPPSLQGAGSFLVNGDSPDVSETGTPRPVKGRGAPADDGVKQQLCQSMPVVAGSGAAKDGAAVPA